MTGSYCCDTLAISGTVAHGDHCRCVMLYEHSLQRSAFQFCYGPFGAVKGTPTSYAAAGRFCIVAHCFHFSLCAYHCVADDLCALLIDSELCVCVVSDYSLV